MIDLEGIGVQVQRAVDVMDVVVEEIVGRMEGQNRLERGRLAHGDLERVEATPGDAPHADRAARARQSRQPADDLQRVAQLHIGVLAGRQAPFGSAGAAHVHLREDVAAADEVLVEGVVAPVEGVVLTVR